MPLTAPLPHRTHGTAPPLASRRGRLAAAMSFLLTALASLAGGWALICTGRALGALIEPADPTGSTGQLLQALGAALVSAACHLAVQLLSRLSAAGEEAHLRRLALGHLLDLGPAASTAARSGATVSLLTDGVERVALYRQTFLAPTVAAALSPLLVLLELGLTVDAVPALVLGAAVVLVPAAIAGLHSVLRAPSSNSRRARTRLAAEYLDAIQGLTTLTLARAARRTQARLERAGEENRRAVMGLLAGNQLVILITDSLFSLFLITAAIAMALLRLHSGAIGAGDALAVALTSYVLLEPLDHVGAFFYVGMGGLANQRAIREVLSRRRPGDPATTVSATGPGPAAPGAAPTRVPVASGAAIELSGLDASWDRSAILTNVDLLVAPGTHLAIVGPSGSGKSTLLAVLAGDLLPSAGTARIHGIELSARTQDHVRSLSALVAQTTWLFTGTIADNLRLASPRATDHEMWRALEAANLAQEVRLMPQGLDTQVGEAGLGLSGGQAQRVSLARAVLADRPVLLLDEPTSQVDLASEAQIVDAVERLARNRTVVTVSHREHALTTCDRLLVVAAGHVTETVAPQAPQTPRTSQTGHAAPVPTASKGD